jgi:hypothetical protein
VHEGVAYLNGAVHVDQFPYQSFLCSAIDLQTGERKWTVDLGVKRYSTTLAIAHEMIYFTTLDALSSHRNPRASGHLHALHMTIPNHATLMPSVQSQSQEESSL